MTSFKILTLFPNISLKENDVNFEKYFSDFPFKIIQPDDPRVSTLLTEIDQINHMIESYQISRDSDLMPALLIIDESIKISKNKEFEAMRSFRNMIAISYLSVNWSWQLTTDDNHVYEPLWSDSFDIYPVFINYELEVINILSDALKSLAHPFEDEIITNSPYLSVLRKLGTPDSSLSKKLSQIWSDLYICEENNVEYVKLLRSLDVAYQAFAISTKNQGSHYQIGLNIVMVVSAIEILVNSMDDDVKASDVVKFFEQIKFSRNSLKHKRYKGDHNYYIRKKIKVNYISSVYLYLYKARNRFVHGSKIDVKELFTPRIGSKRVNIIYLSRIVYRFALVAFLKIEEPNNYYYEKALLLETD